MKSIILAIALLTTSAVGCMAALPVIAKVIAVVSEASLWIDTIESFADQLFARDPNAELQRKVDDALIRARAAAAMLDKAAHGAQDLTDKDLAAAFAEFRSAYDSLLVLVQPLGVQAKPLGEGGKLGASPGRLSVPSADELIARARQ